MKRFNRLGPLEDLGSLPSPTEALAACPMCHSREIWVEKHPNSARSFSIMCRQCRFQVSLLPRAQAIAAWNGMGNGRIAGGGCVSRLALQLETGKTAGLPKVVTPLPARGFCGTLPVLQPLLHFPRNHPAQGPLDTRDLANAFRESRPKKTTRIVPTL
jgi:hypothetical protein